MIYIADKVIADVLQMTTSNKEKEDVDAQPEERHFLFRCKLTIAVYV